MIRGRFYDGKFLLGVDSLLKVRRTAGTIIAYDVLLEDDTHQTRVLDATTGDRVLLSTLNIVGSDTARVLLKRDGAFAPTLRISSRDGKPGTIQVVICGVANCSPPSDHLAAYGADIDPRSLRREADQACWTRNVAMRAPQKECAPLSTD